MSYRLRRIRTIIFCVIAFVGILNVIEITSGAHRKGGLFESAFYFVFSTVLTTALCLAAGAIVHWILRAFDSASSAIERAKPIVWENRIFPMGARVVINREDPDYYENPMVMGMGDTPHSSEIDCDNGKTGVVIGGNNSGSLAVRWDAQEWREHRTRRQVRLPSFESSIHPEHMDLASNITPNNPLKIAQPRGGPVLTKEIDLTNKDWLRDLADHTPMRDFADLPHEVLTHDYFIGLLSNAAIASIGSDHHRLPRDVIRKIAVQVCRRAEHDASLAEFIEVCKTAEPRWQFDWHKAATS